MTPNLLFLISSQIPAYALSSDSDYLHPDGGRCISQTSISLTLLKKPNPNRPNLEIYLLQPTLVDSYAEKLAFLKNRDRKSVV